MTIRVHKHEPGRAEVQNVGSVAIVLVRESDGAEVTLAPGESFTVREGERWIRKPDVEA